MRIQWEDPDAQLGLLGVAEGVLTLQHEPLMAPGGICEKDSISLVSSHPGDRHRDDLLGQRAPCAVDTVDGRRSTDAADAAGTVAGDAAGFAAGTERPVARYDTVSVQPVEHAVAGRVEPVFKAVDADAFDAVTIAEPVADAFDAASVLDEPLAEPGHNLA